MFNRFKIHYSNDRGITYLCLSEDMSDDDSFAFLIDVQRKLNNTNDSDLNCMSAYQLDYFKEELKSLMVNRISNNKLSRLIIIHTR